MATRTVGVVGCGLMGSGIAQVCAAAGYRTIVREVAHAPLQQGLARVHAFLEDGVARGKTTQEAQRTILSNLTGTIEIADLKECDLVIEAIVEELDEKRLTYSAIEEVVPS